MWTLTICSLILLVSVVFLAWLLLRMATVTVMQVTRQLTSLQSQTLEKLIKPVIDPEPIRQIDVPEQTEMFDEPDWKKNWEYDVPL